MPCIICGFFVQWQAMSAITFDRLTYLETLKASGIPEAQARAHAVALDEALRDTVATKGDIEILKRDMTIRMGTMLAAAVGIIVTLIKLL